MSTPTSSIAQILATLSTLPPSPTLSDVLVEAAKIQKRIHRDAKITKKAAATKVASTNAAAATGERGEAATPPPEEDWAAGKYQRHERPFLQTTASLTPLSLVAPLSPTSTIKTATMATKALSLLSSPSYTTLGSTPNGSGSNVCKTGAEVAGLGIHCTVLAEGWVCTGVPSGEVSKLLREGILDGSVMIYAVMRF